MPGPLQLLSPPFLMTSTTKQMQPKGKVGGGLIGLQTTDGDQACHQTNSVEGLNE